MIILASSIENQPISKKTKGKRKYIPGLAAFKFKPTDDWTDYQAKELYKKKERKGLNTIFYEDCINGMEKLPAESVDLIIADPPFGIEFDSMEELYNRDSDFVINNYHEVDKEEYDLFTEKWISKLPKIMKDTSSAYIFSGWNNLEFVLAAARRAGLTLINHLIWTYSFGVFTMRKYVSSHYHILFYVKDPDKYYFNKIIHYPLDSIEMKRNYKRGKKKNSTTLPKELVKKLMDFSSRPGDIVLDPFMGNGTTAVVAKGNYRHYLGFEINERLKSVINKNLDDMKIGALYQPYITLKPSLQELAKKYPKAYKVIKEEGNPKKYWEI